MPNTQLPPEDQAPNEWRRFTDDDTAAAALPDPGLDNPVSVGAVFCMALADPVQFRTALDNLVTPESREAWGDFSEAARMIESFGDYGYGSNADRAEGCEDVAYFKIFRDTPVSYQVLDSQPVMASAIITLAWRESFGRWMVQAIGDYVRPEDVPRG